MGSETGMLKAAAVAPQSASIPVRPHGPQVLCAARRLYQGSVRGPAAAVTAAASHRAVGNLVSLWVFALIPLSITNKHSGS